MYPDPEFALHNSNQNDPFKEVSNQSCISNTGYANIIYQQKT